MSTAMHFAGLAPWIFGILASVAIVCAVVALYFTLRRGGSAEPSAARTDKDLEALRITYGFWLIIGGMVLAFAVAVVVLVVFVPPTPVGTGDIVAVIASVTSVVSTLTAAFFGVQAAGAGRSQAMDKLAGSNQNTVPISIDTTDGPVAGGTLVSISGNGFTGSNAVNFGTNAGTAFTFVNDGLVRVTTPAASAGPATVDVTLVFPNSTSNVAAGTFRYR